MLGKHIFLDLIQIHVEKIIKYYVNLINRSVYKGLYKVTRALFTIAFNKEEIYNMKYFVILINTILILS